MRQCTIFKVYIANGLFEFSLFPGRDLHILPHCSLSISAGAAHPAQPLPFVSSEAQSPQSLSFYPAWIDKHLFSMSSQAALLKTLMNLYELLGLPEVVERVAAVCRSGLESVPDFHTSALPHRM